MKRIIPFFLLLWLAFGVFAEDVGTLSVTVLSSEVKTGITVIEYEFNGLAETYDITAEVSFNQGADFTDIPMEDLSGDLSNVNPGGPYTITWDGMASFDDTYSEETVIRLNAFCILPDAPTAEPASGMSANSFTANWTEVPGAVTYTLDVALDADFTDFVTGYEQVEVVGTTSHTVDGLTSHTIHYYRVQAVDVCGTSDYSDIECVFTADPFVCGDPVMFKYRSQCIVYGTIERGGLCWMDRNLGADPMPFVPADDATGNNDERLYGDLFQWGRGDDGHQDRGSGTTGTQSSDSDPGHSDFITGHSTWYNGSDPDNLWQEDGTGINNPCPPGWRVPSEVELEAERVSWGENNAAGAFGSDLKWSVAGHRSNNTGSLSYVGSRGNYWSSTVERDRSRSQRLLFLSTSANMAYRSRAYGYSVRCIKDE